jgi:hypothetical protein
LTQSKPSYREGRATRQIYNRIQALGLTQNNRNRLASANYVSKLIHSRYTGFSRPPAWRMLNALDVDVEIVLRPYSERLPHRGVRIVEAVA